MKIIHPITSYNNNKKKYMSNKKLVFTYGCMNAGKSAQLQLKAHNFEERKVPFIILKSVLDTRDGSNVVHSRPLGDKECITVKTSENLFKIISQKEKRIKFEKMLLFRIV